MRRAMEHREQGIFRRGRRKKFVRRLLESQLTCFSLAAAKWGGRTGTAIACEAGGTLRSMSRKKERLETLTGFP